LLINNQLGTTELKIIGRSKIIFGFATHANGADTFVSQKQNAARCAGLASQQYMIII
jgi:hypothetical protein